MFRNCSIDVKIVLFNINCTPLYCSYLWTEYKKTSFSKLVKFEGLLNELNAWNKIIIIINVYKTNVYSETHTNSKTRQDTVGTQ